MTAPACQCGHGDERHHPAGGGGVCTVVLPPFVEEELPEWRCPCRRYKPEQLPLAVLASVQSCTVLPAPRAADQCVCPARCAEHPFSVVRMVAFAAWDE